MKKIFVLLMCAFMLSFTSCSSKDNSDSDSCSKDTADTAETLDEDDTEESLDSADVSGDEYPFATPVIPADLSSDPESFQVSLDGNIITLPALYSDFTALGWECDVNTDEETLKSGFMMVGNASLRKGDASLSGVNFINLSDQELPLSECYVCGFSFAYDSKSAVAASVVFPGGLHIGSTIDDITAAYGEPTETDDSRSTATKLIYKFGDYNEITFEIDKNQPPYWNRMTIYREEVPAS